MSYLHFAVMVMRSIKSVTFNTQDDVLGLRRQQTTTKC